MLTRSRQVGRWIPAGLTALWMSGAAWAAPVQFVEGQSRCEVRLTAEPPIGRWQGEAVLRSGDEIVSSGGYRLTLQRSGHDGHATWNVGLRRDDGEVFRIQDHAYEVRTPLGRVASVFDTQVGEEARSIFRQSPQIDVVLEVRPNRGIPFIMACDHYGNNSLAVGPIDQTGTYRITGRRDGGDYAVTVERDEYGDEWFSGVELNDAVFISTQESFWYDAARGFAQVVDAATGYSPRPIPEHAERPYYSTWYAFGEDINQQTVWDNAVIASEIGIGNFLIFIGWSVCEDWFSSDNTWGDYTPCTPRFADFAGMVKRMQDELGLAVQVWVAPSWIGTSSKSFETMEHFRSKWPEGGYDRNLDPRSPEARRHIRERFASLAREQGVDGFWVDFLDTLYNRNDAPHEKDPNHFGTAYAEFIKAYYEGFASARPEPLVEYRIPFANLVSKHHASVFTTTYTDKNWDRNRLLNIVQRPFNDGVLAKTDPLVWTPQQFDHRDFVGQTLSAMMLCGPPGISMDLTKLNEERRRNLKDWFGFYEKHRANLRQGEFRPFGHEYHRPEMMVSHGDTSYAWVSRFETREIPFPEGTRRAYIFIALPMDESFIARIDNTRLTGLVPGRYHAQWYNSVLKKYPYDDPPMEFTVRARTRTKDDERLVSPREVWDFHPDDERPLGVGVRRGGYLEISLIE